MAAPFKPKQVLTLSADDIAEMQGDGSQQVIRQALKLIPPLTSTSVLHDSACGAGAVTETIMDANPPSGIKIHATDLNPTFVAGTKNLAQEKSWNNVETATMDARKLEFPDNTFDLSVTAFMFHCMSGGDKAATEICRTLKPGGTALVTIWKEMPHVPAILAAHYKTRPTSTPLPALLHEEPFTEVDLFDLLRSGGFEKIETHEVVADIRIGELERWAKLAWSYLGRLPGEPEWLKRDEEKWDEAVSTIIDEMNNTAEKDAEGALHMRFVATVVVARK
ncbi:S-adenosyl-L-methionine-dependent methyltransferase [Lophiotrema nucula]|uniref:S-adenosyl-L-methionine-dependent methyltransferase n=1 Tax=Lophiotrema nucula TaxID=690887 RepID=A0A6A5ZXN0_9PLEO|nr:S-adenosyl-L-methionine-dependent methyltransferase [Lophiotrema nucula]